MSSSQITGLIDLSSIQFGVALSGLTNRIVMFCRRLTFQRLLEFDDMMPCWFNRHLGAT
jgi:hypothetical protein